jgi:drug/metabolite transporter (DMT)-like permease
MPRKSAPAAAAPESGNPWKAFLLLPVAPLCWAGNIVLARGVADRIPPVSLAFWRWTLAFAILALFYGNRARRDWPLAVDGWRIMVVLSLTGITGFNTLLYAAVHTTTAINGALIQTTMPAIIILISLKLFREQVSVVQVLGVALCIAGAAAVVLRGDLGTLLQMSFVEGDVLMCVAVVLYALSPPCIR